MIGALNMCCCLCCCGGLLVCIRRRTCYLAAKEISPCCVDLIVACGCGPDDAEQLNNEAVMQASEPMGETTCASAPKPQAADVELVERRAE